MKRISRVICTLAAVIMSLGAVSAANAALNPPAQLLAPVEAAPHPTNGGYPLWYQDRTGLTLSLCLDQNGNCTLPFPAAPDPATGVLVGPFGPSIAPGNGVVPISTVAPLSSATFPIESFYWVADSGAAKTTLQATGGTLPAGKFRIVIGLAAGFATIPFANVQEGQQTAMLRVNIFKMLSGLVPNSPYVITTPYGAITLNSDAAGGFSGGAGGQGFRSLLVGGPLGFNAVLPAIIPPTPGAGGAPGAAAMTIDNFLVCNGGAPAGYIGSPLVGCPAVFANDPLAVPQVVTFSGPGFAAPVVITSFAISGKKFGMDIKPPAADFGANAITTPTATNSTVSTFTITNVNSVSSMTIAAGALTLTGPNAADFVIDPAPLPGAPAPAFPLCSGIGSLPAAVVGTPSSCTVSVAFAPKPLAPAPEVAVRTANLNIAASFPLPTPTTVPPGLITLKGTGTYTMSATPGANGTIIPASNAVIVNAGATQNFTIQPNKKFQVKDILVNGALAHFTAPVKPGDAVTFTSPAATSNGTTVNATFMPSGDLDGNGTLDSADALKALKILVGLQAPVGDDLTAMKVFPLDTTGRPNPTAGAPADLNDVVLILKRALSIITW